MTTAVVTEANTEEIRSDDPEYAKQMESRAQDYLAAIFVAESLRFRFRETGRL